MKKERKKPPKHRPQSMNVITRFLVVFFLAVWVLGMVLVTYSITLELCDKLQYEAQIYASKWASREYVFKGVNQDAPGYADLCRLENMSNSGLAVHLHPNILSAKSGMLENDEFLPYGFAISYHFHDGQRLIEQSSAFSYLAFTYLNATEWENGASFQPNTAYGYINESKLDQSCGDTIWLNSDNQGALARMTGWFEGAEFHPITVETTRMDAADPGKRDRLIWKPVYEASAPADQEAVIIYSQIDSQLWLFDMSDYGLMHLPVTIDDTTYRSLADVLSGISEKDSLTDRVARGYGEYQDTDGNSVHVRVALRANPLGYTIRLLMPFYLITFVLMGGMVGLILHSIHKNLVQPIDQIARCCTGNPTPLPVRYNPRWQEARMLEENFCCVTEGYQQATAEVRQLQTALHYVQNAEMKRREMISNITHELKTPLAIIHSYAEGLKDGIAADKQEQYLNVVLEETERMDSMVLEMLDLSRLEAGKVRLSADRFSLLGLTRSIFNRLAPVAAEKDLQIQFDMVEEFEITADESRIGQVVTNFATNAIKYTPEGGNIWIKVYRHREQTILCLENECEPLPDEVLSKVWDSFYRMETSHTTKGTGLGLSIAKAIIELHGGTVGVQNTSSGVEFRFTLP